MKVTSLLLAVLVAGGIYVLIFERPFVLKIVGARSEMPAPALALQEQGDAVRGRADGGEANISAEAEAKPFSVVSLRSRARLVEEVLTVRGETEAARQVEVRAETAGLVVSQPLRKGMQVHEGQLLCEIDAGTRLSSLARAEASYAEAVARTEEAEVNRRAAFELLERGFGSETDAKNAEARLEAAHAGVTAAQASVADAKKDIERLEIRAPFSGLLEDDTAELGSFLQPGSRCSTIIQLDPIKFVSFVSEKEVFKLSLGAKVVARLISGKVREGEVSFISRSADQNTRTFRVEATSANTDLTISDGQTVELMIEVEGGTYAHELPQSALTLDDGGRLGVRVDRGGVARFVPVEILRDEAERVWVLGLQRAENVIIVGHEYVLDGEAVRSVYREPS